MAGGNQDFGSILAKFQQAGKGPYGGTSPGSEATPTTGLGYLGRKRRSITVAQESSTGTAAPPAANDELVRKFERFQRKGTEMAQLKERTHAVSSPPVARPHAKRHHRSQKSVCEIPLTTEDVNSGVVCKMKGRLYILQRSPVKWAEEGSGEILFKKNTKADKYILFMTDKKSAKIIMDHSIHPQMELKANPGSERSWVWTTTDYAHLQDGKPSVQTFAIKFKRAEAAVLFKNKYEQYRKANAEREAKNKRVHAAKKAQRKLQAKSLSTSALDSSTSTAAADAPLPPPPPANNDPDPDPTPPPPPADSSADAKASAEDTVSELPSSDNKQQAIRRKMLSARTVPNLSALVQSPSSSSTTSAPTPSSYMSDKAHRAANRTFTRGALSRHKGNNNSKKDRLKKFFGDAVPKQVLLVQEEKKYEPANDVAKAFPRRKALRYTKRRTEPATFMSGPVDSALDVDKCESYIKVLDKAEELARVDNDVIQAMIDRLKSENAVLERMVPAASSSASVQSGDDDVIADLSDLHKLASTNQFFVKQRAVMLLGIENLRRGIQFPNDAKKFAAKHSRRGSMLQEAVNPSSSQCFTTLRDPPLGKIAVRELTFKVQKINKIFRNTPRQLRLDLKSSILTICKRSDDAEDDFGSDLEIKPDQLSSVDISPKNDKLLTFAFYITPADTSGFAGFRFDRINKVWKVLFTSKEERERFYRLMQIHMAAVSSSESSGDSTYMPTPVRVTSKLMVTVRMLQKPVHELASQLHQMWCNDLIANGWRYGAERQEREKRHPLLLPYKQLLKTSAKKHYVGIVQHTLASALATGFRIEKRVDMDQEDDVHTRLHAVSSDIEDLVKFLAQNSHDTWWEQKMSEGWTVQSHPGPPDFENRTDPMLVPFNKLPHAAQQMERNAAYKVIGSLLEWGYNVQKDQSKQLAPI